MKIDSILLVEYKTENGGKRVELPAGKVERGIDKTILNTATREFLEETGEIITLPKLEPLIVRYHKNGRGGLLFYTQIPKLRTKQYDDLGKRFLTPPKGTDKGRVTCLVLEPLHLFLDRGKTLLRYSQNQWAVDLDTRLTLAKYMQQKPIKTRRTKKRWYFPW